MKKVSIFLLLSILGVSQFFAQPNKPVKAQPKKHIKMCIDLPIMKPSVDDDDEVVKGVASTRLWNVTKTLKIKFLEGDPAIQAKVKKYSMEWTKYANLNFEYVEVGNADIRIAFDPNTGSWSRIGTDAGHIDQNEATINFGWFTAETDESEIRRTTLHEFGHALGLCHEHQHPTHGIPWDKEAVYQYYLMTQGWDRKMVDDNVFRRYERNFSQYTVYDPNSIMHYPIDEELTQGAFNVGMNMGLSETDKKFISQLYPGRYNPSTGTTTTSTTPTKPNPNTTTSTAGPTAPAYIKIKVSDILGEEQYAEKAAIEINGVVKVFNLKQGENDEDYHVFKLPGEGTYNYRIHAYTTFYFTRNGKTYTQKQEGFGKGVIQAKEGKTYMFAAEGMDDTDGKYDALLEEVEE